MAKKVTVYKESKKVKYRDLFSMYKKGACLLIEKGVKSSSPERIITVVAKSNYDLYSLRSSGELEEYFPEGTNLNQLEILNIAPIPKTRFFLTPYICNDEFFKMDLFDDIKSLCERMSYAYEVPIDEIEVMYLKDHSHDGYIALGVTVEESSENPYEDIFPSIRLRRKPIGELRDKKDGKLNIIDEIKLSIDEFLETTEYLDFHEEISKKVLGQPALSTVTLGVYTYLKSIVEGRNEKANIMIAGGSGTGKTETFRAIRDYFAKKIPSLPILQYDISNLSPAGYKGINTTNITSLIASKKTDGIAIMYLDEVDKKLQPDIGSKGIDYNAVVQSELLTMIEGSRGVTEETQKVDTSNTLFLFGGSFENIRKKREVKTVHAGFGQESEEGESHFSPITREEIIKQGALYELMGRIPILVNYEPLEQDIMESIIVREINKVSTMIGVPIMASDRYMQQLKDLSKSEYGARAVASNIYEAAFPAFTEASMQGHRVGEYKIVLDGEYRFEIEKHKVNVERDTYSSDFECLDDLEEDLPFL